MHVVVTIETPSLGDRSYLVHDGADAVVVDPQRDIGRVLAAAQSRHVRITHVLETHIHNDYVTGGLALARHTGAAYVVAASEEVGFERLGVGDHDQLSAGSLTVTALHTPGHTPGHMSFVLGEDGPGPGRPGCLSPADRLALGARVAPLTSPAAEVILGGEHLPGGVEGARTMKNIAGTALQAVAGLTLLGACAALIANKDDIRRYLRMRSM